MNRVILALTLVAVGQGALAKAGSSYIIILGGGPIVADAKAALDRYPVAAQALVPGAGFPKLEVSDTIPGLNPGYHIAVFGVCASEETARLSRDLLNLGVPGTYIRKVDVEIAADTCPRLRSVPTTAISPTRSFRTDVVKPVHKGVPNVTWEALRKDDQTSCAKAALRLNWGPRLIAERLFIGESCEPDGTKVSYAATPVETGSRILWLIRRTRDWVDNGASDLSIVSFACGEIRDVYETTVGGNSPQVLLRATGKGNDAWQQLALSVDKNDVSLGWNPTACRYDDTTLSTTP